MNLNIFKRLNILKRIDDLVDDVLRLSGRIERQNAWLHALYEEVSKLHQAKQTDADKIAKRRAYARAWYAANKKKK